MTGSIDFQENVLPKKIVKNCILCVYQKRNILKPTYFLRLYHYFFSSLFVLCYYNFLLSSSLFLFLLVFLGLFLSIPLSYFFLLPKCFPFDLIFFYLSWVFLIFLDVFSFPVITLPFSSYEIKFGLR